MDFAARIAAWRNFRRLTRKDLAARIDCSVSIISYWETGGCEPPLTKLHEIVTSGLGTTMARFWAHMPKARKQTKASAGARA